MFPSSSKPERRITKKTLLPSSGYAVELHERAHFLWDLRLLFLLVRLRRLPPATAEPAILLGWVEQYMAAAKVPRVQN